MFRSIAFFAATAICTSCTGIAHAAMTIVSDTKPAIVVRTDEIVVHSAEIGRDYIIEVTLPDLPPDKKAPVVYALDGGYGIVGPAARLMAGGNRIAPAYIVSIGYPNPRGHNFGPREADFLHKKITLGDRTLGGGGAAFESFLLKEVRPMIEARYAIDPKCSVLVGHSSGAIFATTMLLTHPDAFSAYVIGSMPIRGYDSTIPDQLRAIAAHGDGKRVFVGLSPDDVAARGSDAYAPALTGKESTFQVRSEVFEGESHVSSYLALVTRGLPFVLPPERP